MGHGLRDKFIYRLNFDVWSLFSIFQAQLYHVGCSAITAIQKNPNEEVNATPI